MKKIVSLLAALSLIFMISLPAYAQTTEITTDDVQQDIDDIISYIHDGSSFSLDDAVTLYYLTMTAPDAIPNDMMADFFNVVEQNLAENDGKLIPTNGENMATYAAVINLYYIYSDDTTPDDINGFDLIDTFMNYDTSTITNPYDYTVILPVASNLDEDFCYTLTDKYIDDYYTPGQGVDYWGYSCDNVANFITAISNTGYTEKYADVLTDAMEVLDTYKVDGGYCFNPEYGTDANVDSTAMALMAKSSYYLNSDGDISDEELQELLEIYDDIMAFKGDTTGSYNYDGTESAYSSFDVLKGLNEFYYAVMANEISSEFNDLDDEENYENASDDVDEEIEETADDTAENAKQVREPVTAVNSTPKSYFPKTGDLSSEIVLAIASVAGLGLIVSKKKKDD